MSNQPKEPSIVKIVRLLAEGDYTTAEIATKLELSRNSVRSLISLLACLGIVEKQALEYRGVTAARAGSYRLTEYGKVGLNKLKEEGK